MTPSEKIARTSTKHALWYKTLADDKKRKASRKRAKERQNNIRYQKRYRKEEKE